MTAAVQATPAIDPAAGPDGRLPPFTAPLVLALAIAVLLVHVAVNQISPYGIHRDEFLYFAMGRHLRPWRMDFPPMIAMLAQVERGLLGDSLLALRFASALAGAAVVALAGLIARELGGRTYAQGLAALAPATLPLFLRAGNLFQPVVFDQLWWSLALLALARVARRAVEDRGDVGAAPPARDWLLLGAAAGLGLLTKFSIVFIGFGILVALLVTPLRRTLRTRWPWLALLIALAIGAPSLVGQLRLGWPVLGQMADLRGSQLARVEISDFLMGQLLLLGPLAAIATIGLLYLLVGRPMERFRVVGWSCLVALLVVMLLHGKPYYIGPAHPTLLAAGVVALERVTGLARSGRGRRWATPARVLVVLLTLGWGALVLPLSLPLIRPAPMARYARALGVSAATTTNVGEVLELPQDYADMLGWPEQVDSVARVWRDLPAADRSRAVIIATNYGEAGAIDFYGPRLGLPPAVAPVGSYWFFGPGSKAGDVAVVVGSDEEELRRFFRDVRLAATVDEPWVVPEERHLPIWVCRAPLHTLQEVWPSFRGQN